MLLRSRTGNPVRFGDGPAAVIGDEGCRMSLAARPGRRSRRMIRKSEDLPGHIEDTAAWTASCLDGISVDKKGTSRIDFKSIRDFFWPCHSKRTFLEIAECGKKYFYTF